MKNLPVTETAVRLNEAWPQSYQKMKSSIIKKPKSVVDLDVKVTAGEMVEFFNQALKKAQGEFSLEGFRKGHVPEELVIKHLGRQYIEAESLDIAVQETYVQALKEHKISPVAQPKVDIRKFKIVETQLIASIFGDNQHGQEDVALEYSAVVDVLPEVEIKDYKKIKIKKDPKAFEVTDSEVEKVFDHLRRQRAKLEPIDRPLKKGDWAEIEFEGLLEGVKRDDLSSKNYPIIIGENQLIPGFEDQLIGSIKGQTKSFSINFPKDYPRENFRKKRAEFQLTVVDTKERIIPEIDNEFIQDLGHEKLEELRDAIKKSLKQEKETLARNKLENEIFDEIIKRTKIDLPDSLTTQEVDRMLDESKDRLAKVNFDWQRYLDQLKKSEADLKNEMKPQAEKNIKVGLILGKITVEEGIDPAAKDGAHQVMEKLVEYANH